MKKIVYIIKEDKNNKDIIDGMIALKFINKYYSSWRFSMGNDDYIVFSRNEYCVLLIKYLIDKKVKDLLVYEAILDDGKVKNWDAEGNYLFDVIVSYFKYRYDTDKFLSVTELNTINEFKSSLMKQSKCPLTMNKRDEIRETSRPVRVIEGRASILDQLKNFAGENK